jgi:lipoprotein
MRSDIKQILLFAGFGFISCIFVFWVPWGNNESISPNISVDSGSSFTTDSEEVDEVQRVPHFS